MRDPQFSVKVHGVFLMATEMASENCGKRSVSGAGDWRTPSEQPICRGGPGRI